MPDYTGLHLATSALLTIDVQNDFTLAGAPAEILGTRQAVPALRQVVTGFRAAGLPIVHVVRLYLPDGSNAERARREVIEAGGPMVAPGTPGADLVADLQPPGGIDLDADLLLSGRLQAVGRREWVMYKPRWGAFFATPLHDHLAALGVDTVVICGCNLPNCPRATIYEASERDYRIGLVGDATSGLYERARGDLEGIGVHLLTAQSCAARIRKLGATTG